ncbi:MAG: NUDIX domain-containing protein [Chloroflexi bacterium]|nr:NUDIX domain-containing protein [Chloroflexota bacterium]
MQRHFTVTGFVAHDGRTALHWHRLGRWLPPGGHIEPNEDPLEAVLREVREEIGLDVEVIETTPGFGYGGPRQLPVPATIAIYDLADGDGQVRDHHQHIDLVYFTRPRGASATPASDRDEDAWLWVDAAQLRADIELTHPTSGRAARVPGDVRELGLAALAAAERAPASTGR